ncbi:hypothetical protein FRX31_030735 [Thalictrum thalictroides]|uniref:WRKY domain-containing protein n=1 Tax=Thalictrum thalictroides TaxID=46969 RepID=A0A7J6V4M7_THATH|nr:hypothetical protein FRX31_030735 [Thalictrum thalictroides]
MTESEADHLKDGYRWRKYGQKAVKNSPYPRMDVDVRLKQRIVTSLLEENMIVKGVLFKTYGEEQSQQTTILQIPVSWSTFKHLTWFIADCTGSQSVYGENSPEAAVADLEYA